MFFTVHFNHRGIYRGPFVIRNSWRNFIFFNKPFYPFSKLTKTPLDKTFETFRKLFGRRYNVLSFSSNGSVVKALIERLTLFDSLSKPIICASIFSPALKVPELSPIFPRKFPKYAQSLQPRFCRQVQSEKNSKRRDIGNCRFNFLPNF